MKKIITCITLLFLSVVNGQNNQPSDRYVNLNIKSPGVSDFIKYGNLTSANYTGELKVDIPLLNINIPNQSPIEASLTYVGSGFKPGKRNGIVGQNWFLNVGGMITRKINGMPDDKKGEPAINGSSSYTNGFLVGIANKIHNPNDVFYFSSTTGYTASNYERYLFGNSTQNQTSAANYETEPDVFTFNFNGINGKFFMGNDGVVRVITDSPNSLKIDLSELAFQEIVTTTGSRPKTPSRIKITDDQGNLYLFGGETKNLEYSLNISGSSSIVNPQNSLANKTSNNNPVINSWMLYEIDYNNGNKVYFNYKNDSLPTNLTTYFANESGGGINSWNSSCANCSFRDFLQLNEYYSEERNIFQSIGSLPGSGSSISGIANMSLSLSLNKIAILESIESDNFRIAFNYSRQLHKFNTRTTGVIYYDTNLSYFNNFIDIKLDNLQLINKVNNSVVKTINLAYNYLGGADNSRMLLRSVTESGKPPHVFEYYDESTILPSPITYGIDHWGFWNGKNETSNQLIPTHQLLSNGDIYYPTNDANAASRNPVFSYALIGQLKKITYPTKGTTTFEYDTHQYNQRLEIRNVDGFVPKLYPVTDNCGGVRIKKIYDNDGQNDLLNTKEYQYTTGIMLKWPRYSSAWSCPGFADFGYIRSNPIGKNLAEELVITYSEVKEVLNNNGYTVTKFRDFISNPDIDNSGYWYALPSMATCVIPSGLAKNYTGYFLNDCSIERGKPKWVKTYDVNNNLKQEDIFNYNESTSRFNLFSTTVHLSGPFQQSNKMYYYNDYLTQKTSTMYLNNGITTTDNFVYDNNLLRSKSSVVNNGDVLSTNYLYAFDSSMASEPFRTNLVSKNMIGIPLKTESYRNTTKISEELLQFDMGVSTSNLLMPKYFYSRIGTDVSLERNLTIDKYDSKGNVIQFTKENGITTTYLWGYLKSLPIAKIENAKFTDILTALGVSETNLLNSADIYSTSINNLRSNVNFRNAMITTYAHLPFIGIISVIDPKGTITHYTYDVDRLKTVTDNEDNLLNSFEYHYKP